MRHHWTWKFHESNCRNSRWWLFWSFFDVGPVWRTICGECSWGINVSGVIMSRTVRGIIGWRMGLCELLGLWRQRRRWRSVAGRTHKLVGDVARLGRQAVTPYIMWIDYLFHTNTFSRETCLFQYWQWSKNILLDHVNDKVQMRDNDCGHACRISQKVIELLKVALSVSFLFYMFSVVI